MLKNKDNKQILNEHTFPKTRYQGSKYKLRDFLKSELSSFKFNTVLDAFSGTSTVGYILKELGKEVISNDKLNFNSVIAKALIENNFVKLDKKDILFIFNQHAFIKYENFIFDNFKDIYYTDDENKWLDITVQNILHIECEYKRAIAFWALYQSCLSKRPYNLFHRKNLYVRFADVKRDFGNKKTWDGNCN